MADIDSTSDTPLKRCTRCKQEKPANLDNFPAHKHTRSGLDSWCRECRLEYSRERNKLPSRQKYHKEYMAKYRVEHEDELKVWREQYRLDHADEIKAYRKRHYDANADYIRAKANAYGKANRPRINQTRAAWKARNPEKVAAKREANREYFRNYTRTHRAKNPAMNVARKQRRRARVLSLPDSFTAQDWETALAYFGNCCAVCGRSFHADYNEYKPHADHWIPLASVECPGTIPENIVPLCGGVNGCNESKGHNDPVAWLVRRFGEDQAAFILERVNAYFAWLKT